MSEERSFSKPKKETKKRDQVSVPVDLIEKILEFLYNPYDVSGHQSEVYNTLRECLENSTNPRIQHYLEVWDKSAEFDTPVDRARYFTENLRA